MSLSGDFIPSDQALDETPSYPVVFGVPFTPIVSGALLALLGLGGAVALFVYLVLPELEVNQQLSAKVSQTQGELDQQATIRQKIDAAKKELEDAKQQREDVLTLFANEDAIRTQLLDINQQVKDRNADLARRKEQKLAQCPPIVRENVRDFEEKIGPLATEARVKTFSPQSKESGVIADGSYGVQVDNKLNREVALVELIANYEQTSAILQNIERLQPLLVIRELSSKADDKSKSFIGFPGFPSCVPDTQITTKFRLEALLPSSAGGDRTNPNAPPGQKKS